MDNKMYEIVKNITPRRYILILIIFIVLFVIQTITLYLQFIPDAVSVYKSTLSTHELSKLNLIMEKIASWYLVWPILTISQTIAMIILGNKIHKNIKSDSV